MQPQISRTDGSVNSLKLCLLPEDRVFIPLHAGNQSNRTFREWEEHRDDT